jgi:hypothetical protein
MESLIEGGDYKVQVVVAKLELHPQSRKAKRKERQVVAWPCWQAAKGGRSFFRDHMGYAAVSDPPYVKYGVETQSFFGLHLRKCTHWLN